MITKERLKELIEQEATVWFISDKYVTPFWLFKDNNYIGLENMELYENKEDAEFVSKYHTSKPEYFKPPLYENIEYDSEFDIFAYCCHIPNTIDKAVTIWVYKTGKISVDSTYDKVFEVKTNTKENYYKAVEIARKLFLGEVDD